MTQPLARRLMTEATFQRKADEQDEQLASHEARIGAVETLRGLAPGDLSDATVASLVANPDSQTTSALGTPVAALTADKVEGIGVGRIVATKDPDFPLEDGDLMILIDTPRYFTDFSGYPTGQAPADWSLPWSQGNYTVVDDAGADGGKVLREGSSSSVRRPISWDAIDEDAATHADVEVVFKWRANQESAVPRSILRGAGGPGDETGYLAGHSITRSGLQLGYYVNGSATLTTDENVGPAWVDDQWYITRARAEGTTVSARTWVASEPEPVQWQITREWEHVNTPGFVGLLPQGPGVKDYNWMGVAFDGGPAPKEAI